MNTYADKLIIELYNKSVASPIGELTSIPEYVRLSEEYDKILKELLMSLPKEKSSLWNKLESIIFQKENINLKDAYIKGFKDGATIIISLK